MAQNSSRPYEPNPAIRALYSRFFAEIQVDEEWLNTVRKLSAAGTVVYVLRSRNVVDFLALDYLTKQHRLPQVHFVNDLGLWILNPLGRGWWNAILPRKTSVSEDLEQALSTEVQGSAVLFLKRPPSALDVAQGARRGRIEGDEIVRTLLDLQRKRGTPIFLIPQVFVWSKFHAKRGLEPLDLLLGPKEWPSAVRTFGQFLNNYRHVELKTAEPINLAQFLEQSPQVSDATLVRRLTYAVLRRLERERRSITGPGEKPPERVRQELVRSPKMQEVIADLADERTSREELTARALKMFEELQATPAQVTIRALEFVFRRLVNKIYAGIEYEKSDVERLRAAAHNGTLILLPSHKSHMDYLIFSYLFNELNLPLPLIAAGDNLNFFPLGPVFRRGGAFFIRRSFRGDRLYASVVDAYVRRLIRHGYPIEVFLEGGRSRTGKLLTPKFGLLNMIVDAALAVTERPSYFVPVSIAYERVIEASSFEHEMRGGDKAKEDAAGLLRSSEVLRHRYGRISMQFGQILSLSELQQEIGANSSTPLSPAKRRNLVTRLGNRVMDEINRVTAVTPGALTALVLLSHEQPGILHDELVARCAKLLKVLQSLNARVSPTLVTPGGTLRPDAVRESCRMFAEAELLRVDKLDVENELSSALGYVVESARRLRLDTSKNGIIHFFLERSLVALAASGAARPRDEVKARVLMLSQLFKFEFRFRADLSFEAIFEETLARMLDSGELSDHEGQILPGPGREGWSGAEWLKIYTAILKNFLEGYELAARALDFIEDEIAERDWIKRALSFGQRSLISGDIQRAEAINKPLLQNALQSLAALDYVAISSGKVRLGSRPASELLLQIQSFLNR